MFKLLERFKAAATQYSDGGAVYCPAQQRDVEIDHCFGCSRLLGMKKANGIVEVRCKSAIPSARLAPY